MKIPEYLILLKELYESHANADEAVLMKKYMKDRYEYYGIKSPVRKALYKLHRQKSGLIPEDNIVEITKWCWQMPQREYQYFAMESLGKVAKKADRGRIELYEFLVTHKSWWDTVDYIASNLVGVYFQKFPEQIPVLTKKWMDSEDMWLQRTCLLFQLKYRADTDTKLLEKFILRLSESKEFFIRKAIGWALREYSKTDPEYVKEFVAKNQLSGLSEREALKWMKNKGRL